MRRNVPYLPFYNRRTDTTKLTFRVNPSKRSGEAPSDYVDVPHLRMVSGLIDARSLAPWDSYIDDDMEDTIGDLLQEPESDGPSEGARQIVMWTAGCVAAASMNCVLTGSFQTHTANGRKFAYKGASLLE